MQANFEMAVLLMQQSRHELAEQKLRQAIAEDPADPRAHALLALCLIERKQLAEATEEALQAVRLGPSLGLAHYAAASVLARRNRPEEARCAINEAIRLEPQDPDHWAMLAAILLDLRQWSEVLEAAERGLQLDAEHPLCTHLRGMALVRLGRRDEAAQTMAAALARNPQDPMAHMNEGWRRLHTSEADKALHHFREALRLDPTLEGAREGMVEALKARYTLYRWMLRYFLWMAGLSRRTQWGLILGAWFGQRILKQWARIQPEIAPWIWPILAVYGVFVFMTWLAVPLTNLALRLNRFGRHVLSREQILGSNLVGGLLLAAVGAAVATVASGMVAWAILAVVCGLLALPASRIYDCSEGWPRIAMATITGTLALLGMCSVGLLVLREMVQAQELMLNLGAGLFALFTLGVIASTFGSTYLAMVQPKR